MCPLSAQDLVSLARLLVTLEARPFDLPFFQDAPSYDPNWLSQKKSFMIHRVCGVLSLLLVLSACVLLFNCMFAALVVGRLLWWFATDPRFKCTTTAFASMSLPVPGLQDGAAA